MSEKADHFRRMRGNCTVPGHGHHCCVARERQQRDGRRAKDKRHWRAVAARYLTTRT